MEGDHRWSCTTFPVAIPPPTVQNFSSDCFLDPNWDTSTDRNDPFESALSSLVSSPAASNAGAGNGFVFRELIGKLGSICNNSGEEEMSPQSCKIGSTNTSCYTNTTPLNSPPKLNLSSLIMETRIRAKFGGENQVSHLPDLAPLNSDPGFVERAAKFSCFGGLGGAQFGSEMGHGSFPKSDPGNLSRVSSAQEMLNSEKNEDMGDSREGSSVSEQNPGGELGVKAQMNTNSRKRKVIPNAKGPGKEDKAGRENDESSCAKRSKPDEDSNAEEAAKLPVPPKDYIHVRARRGQATDSHSLAERVRREKISERMKFLQDLVPDCNKATNQPHSGEGDADILKRAHQRYFEQMGHKEFKEEHAWIALRDEPKWSIDYLHKINRSNTSSGSSKRSRSDMEGDTPTSEINEHPIERPMGIKAAKRKGKASASTSREEHVEILRAREQEQDTNFRLMHEVQMAKEARKLEKQKGFERVKKIELLQNLMSKSDLPPEGQALVRSLMKELCG